MEKALQPYDNERIRLAMLKHEEIFKEQVYELHRLYRIQKMLMDNVGFSQQQQKQQRQKQERFLVESKKQPFMIVHHHQNQMINADYSNKSKSNFIGLLQRSHDQHQVGVVRSSDALEHIAESNNNNNNVSMMLDENEIELTLSLGPSVQNPRRRKTDKSESGQSISSSSTGSSQTRKSSPKKSSSSLKTRSGDDQFTWGPTTTFTTTQGSEKEPGFSNGQQTNPPWLLQTLSLKLT